MAFEPGLNESEPDARGTLVQVRFAFRLISSGSHSLTAACNPQENSL
jgi:hypothetical protein